MEVEELKKINEREHKFLREQIEGLHKAIETNSQIRNWQRWIIGIFISVIIILGGWSGFSLNESRKAQDQSLKALRDGVKYQKKALDIQLRYSEQLDSITKELRKQRTVLFPLSDTVGKMFDSIEWFYKTQWIKERKFTHSVYVQEIHPNTIRSKENRKRIIKLEEKLR